MPTFFVNWEARFSTPTIRILPGQICEVRSGVLGVDVQELLIVGSSVSVEFYVNFRDKRNRRRAKTNVTYSLLRSNSESTYARLSIQKMNQQENHTLNNVIQAL